MWVVLLARLKGWRDTSRAGATRLNEWVALKLADWVMGMPLFWTLFVGLLITYRYWPNQTAFLSSNWFQAWALPALGAASDFRDRRARTHREEIEAQRQEDHDRLLALMQELHQLHQELHGKGGPPV